MNQYNINDFLNTVKTNNPKSYSEIPIGSSPKPQVSLANKNSSELNDEFVKENKKNGLIEKFYNYCKNKTGLGIGSKKVEQKINEFNNGKASKEEVENKLSDYKISQENAAQSFGDFASASVGISSFFKLSNILKEGKARYEIYDALHPFLAPFSEMPIPALKKFNTTVQSITNSKIKSIAVILPFVMLAGACAKCVVLKLNRIGSNEFKIENKDKLDKDQLKKTKKELSRSKLKADLKNFCTGALNGLLVPITTIAGGIVGIPAYILATSGIRYLTSKNDKKEKSFNNFTENLKNNAVLNSLFAVAIAAIAFKQVRYSNVLGENLNKVVQKLKDAQLQDSPSSRSAYEELEEIMFDDPKIKSILKNSASDINTQIQDLTKENIFAVKFKQISNNPDEIAKHLIEDCPPSRTIEQAQKEINKLLGHNEYDISKCLGVGTVAECYLGKDKSGKEVCIKILKEGINLDKIQKDKKAFIDIVTNNSTLSKTKQEYLIKNIEDLAKGISKEVDLENELKAAEKLRKYTKQANVVVPITAKPGIYVMEKAPGISLDTLIKYHQAETKLARTTNIEEIAKYTEEIEALKAKSPDFNDFNLLAEDAKRLLGEYNNVQVEQFTRIDKNGNPIHGDIHSGNLMVDVETLIKQRSKPIINLEVLKKEKDNPIINIEALKKGKVKSIINLEVLRKEKDKSIIDLKALLEALKKKKGKPITLIDTGNVIDLTKEQAIHSRRLISYIRNGNVKDITKYIMDGAVLPEGMTQEEAVKIVEKDLKEIFFDNKTKLNLMTSDELYKLRNGVLRNHNIIPNDTQLSLNKAKKSAENSYVNLINYFFGKKFENMFANMEGLGKKELLSLGKDVSLLTAKKLYAPKIQEFKNLFHMGFEEFMKKFKNPNMIKTNSVDHLTYKLKQGMNNESIDKLLNP